MSKLKKDTDLQKKYDKLSFTRKKEIYNLLTGAKKEETLQNRLRKVLLEIKSPE